MATLIGIVSICVSAGIGGMIGFIGGTAVLPVVGSIVGAIAGIIITCKISHRSSYLAHASYRYTDGYDLSWCADGYTYSASIMVIYLNKSFIPCPVSDDVSKYFRLFDAAYFFPSSVVIFLLSIKSHLHATNTIRDSPLE